MTVLGTHFTCEDIKLSEHDLFQRFVIASSSLLSVILLSGCPFGTPKAPRPPPINNTPPARYESLVAVPVKADIANIRAELEASVPGNVPVPGAWGQVGKGADGPSNDEKSFGYKFWASREAVKTTAVDGGMDISVDLKVNLCVRKRFEVLAEACTDKDRRVSLHFQVRPSVNADWNVAPGISLKEVQIHDKLKLNIDILVFRISLKDVTDLANSRLTTLLAEKVQSLNAKLSEQINLRGRLQRAFSKLREPLMVGQDVFLAVEPTELGLGAIRSEGDSALVFHVRAKAYPSIIYGPKPGTLPGGELPRQSNPIAPESRFNLSVPVSVNLDTLNSALRRELRIDSGGIRFPPVGEKYTKIKELSSYALGSQLVMRVVLEGSVDAIVYLTGTPALPQGTTTLTFPDLEFTVESRKLLVKLADWLKHDQIVSFLRNKARIDFGQQLEKANHDATTAINKIYGDLKLTGELDGNGVGLVGIYADGESNVGTLYLRASGAVSASATSP
jgi:hypothetical protein